MTDFIEGEDRTQSTLFPERLDDYITEDNAVRVIDVFIDELDLSGLGFRTEPQETGRPAYNPATLLKQRANEKNLSLFAGSWCMLCLEYGSLIYDRILPRNLVSDVPAKAGLLLLL